jgi:hypothetical protein
MKFSRRKKLCASKSGQIADPGADAVAIIFIIFIDLLMYALFTISGVGNVVTPGIDKISSTTTGPYQAMTLASYLRAEIPSSIDLQTTTTSEFPNEDDSGKPLIDDSTRRYLSDQPELWQDRSYAQFLAMILATESDNPSNLRSVFDAVTRAAFTGQNKRLRFILEYDSTGSRQTATSDVGGRIGTTLPEKTTLIRIPALSRQDAILKLYIPGDETK